jgi:hypothetical protein
MRDTVGFRMFAPIFFPEMLKRDAVMFKKIGVLCCEEIPGLIDGLPEDHAAELRWLIEQGIIFDPRLSSLRIDSFLDDETRTLIDESLEITEQYRAKIDERVSEMEESSLWKYGKNTLEENVEFIKRGLLAGIFSDLYLRPLAAYYRNNKNMDAYPLFYNEYPEFAQKTASAGDVADITINYLPLPDDSTPWEQILDFRDDPDSERKFLGFRVWMNDIARAKMTPLEVEQKLEWLIHEYEQHMKLHRMKTNAGAWETIIVTGAEIAENLVKFQFGKAAKALFSIRHRKLALLEGELKSPGREIAFISKAQETFR